MEMLVRILHFYPPLMDILRSVPMMRIRAFGSFCSTEFQRTSVACVIPDRDRPDGEKQTG